MVCTETSVAQQMLFCIIFNKVNLALPYSQCRAGQGILHPSRVTHALVPLSVGSLAPVWLVVNGGVHDVCKETTRAGIWGRGHWNDVTCATKRQHDGIGRTPWLIERVDVDLRDVGGLGVRLPIPRLTPLPVVWPTCPSQPRHHGTEVKACASRGETQTAVNWITTYRSKACSARLQTRGRQGEVCVCMRVG